LADQPLTNNNLLEVGLAGAKLDVYESEPRYDLEFLQNTYFMLTPPHIGGNTEISILTIGSNGTKHLKDYFFGNQTL
jgi:lactate dehydrogenase-like 2-hydroxyacid dehydrogenase